MKLSHARVCRVSHQVGSADVYLMSGHGVSCVSKNVQAAWAALQALQVAEQQQQQEDSDDDIDEDARTQQQGEDEVREPCTPSVELLARQPDVLRIPFELQGRWSTSTSNVVISKKHTFGSDHEIMYQGTCTLSADGRTLTLQMRCAFATALLIMLF